MPSNMVEGTVEVIDLDTGVVLHSEQAPFRWVGHGWDLYTRIVLHLPANIRLGTRYHCGINESCWGEVVTTGGPTTISGLYNSPAGGIVQLHKIPCITVKDKANAKS